MRGKGKLRGRADKRKGEFTNPALVEKKRPVRLIPGPGRYFVFSAGKEIAHFDEFSGPYGAKAYLDDHGETLPSGTEVVRRKDGRILAFIAKSSRALSEPV